MNGIRPSSGSGDPISGGTNSDALEAGDLKEAKRVYGLMAPLFALEAQHGVSYTEILSIRGVIKSGRQRGGRDRVMDEHDHRVLDNILGDLEPLFTWHDPGAKRS